MTTIKPISNINHPKFKALAKRRTRFCFLMSLYILVSYAIYIFGMSFTPDLMAIPYRAGSSITCGILLALFVIVNGMICSGIYAWWANKYIDPMKRDFLNEVTHEE